MSAPYYLWADTTPDGEFFLSFRNGTGPELTVFLDDDAVEVLRRALASEQVLTRAGAMPKVDPPPTLKEAMSWYISEVKQNGYRVVYMPIASHLLIDDYYMQVRLSLTEEDKVQILEAISEKQEEHTCE